MIELRQIFDLETLLAWRREVIENVFNHEPSSALMQENESYYRRHIPDNTHLAFVADVDGEEAGCGSVCLTDELPSPDNTDGKCAYLMNIYVRKNFRTMGVAHKIVERLIREAKMRGCNKIYLETTTEGRPVYESLGFKDLPDMMKLKQSSDL